jgi:hypothetical protein
VAQDHSEIKTNAMSELYLEDDSGRVTRLFRFREALERAQIDVATYYRWVKNNKLHDVRLLDHGRWRVFTEAEVNRLVNAAHENKKGQAIWQSTENAEIIRDNWRNST